MPSIDVVTGAVTDGPIVVGEEFQWTCSECSGNVYVIAQDMGGGLGPWFTPSGTDASFTAPGGSVTVTAKGVNIGTGWTYTANVNTDDTRIHVDSSMPGVQHKKAS
jgi:hypothetical protein